MEGTFLLPCSHRRKRLRPLLEFPPPPPLEPSNLFDAVPDEILFLILDALGPDSFSKKSFSLVSRSFHSAECRHRRSLTPLRTDLLPTALARYPFVPRVDLSLCPRVPDTALICISNSLGSGLRSIDLSRSRSFSRIGIESLVVNCSGLVEVNLSNGMELGDSAVAVIGRARNLERLWLARCKMVTDMGIGCVAVGCPKLKLLCLKWCLGISDLGVGLVAVKCRELRSLDLSFMMITQNCLPAVSQLPHLEDLALVGCLGINDAGLMTLMQGFKSLKVLNMSNCQYVSHAGLSYLINGAAGLKQLILEHCSLAIDSLASSLRKLCNLQCLRLDGYEVTTCQLQTIGESCQSLKELSLSKCAGVNDDGLTSVVSRQKNLVKLDITCCHKITDGSLVGITRSCPYLTSLRMESCSLVSRDGFILIGEHCRFLEELDLTDTDVDNEGLKAFSKCYKLSVLKIGICLNISDEGLIHVGDCCPKLIELDLYRSVGVTDAGISAIALGCPMLQIINIAYCTEITDDSLRSLAKCSELNTLEIRGCSRITNVGLSAITVGCKRIAKLDIKKCCHINDAGILSLARLSQNLRQINLSYCSVTDVGLLALATISCLQNMAILHVKGLTPSGLVTALLACGGLTKVRLHLSFRSLISRFLLEHIEARGCVFQWRNKPFQIEVDTNEVWKQKSRSLCAV